ncbi:MAG TPA: hypothetical protein VGZ52_06250 [Acidimicrobiales bacterium]|nr:hypothetical protein [Acidimicrobiales bacterium]
MRAARAFAGAVLVLALASACSGSQPNLPEGGGTFADATCADLARWAGATQAAYRDLRATGQFDPSNPTATQDQLSRLSTELSNADQATARLSDGISSRRAPDVANGEQVKKTILDSLKALRDVAAKARAAIDGFDARAATKEQSTAVRSSLDAITSSVTETVAGLAPLLSSSPQLRAALESSATCRQAGSQLFSS